MALGIRGTHVLAAAIAAGIGLWMLTGDVRIGGAAGEGEQAPSIADREAERDADAGAFKVRYVPLQAEARSETILVRGRTIAEAIVSVRAETSGILDERLVGKGERVEAGQLVCRIRKADREARLAQAMAQLISAEGDYEAARQLEEKGFAAQNRVATLKSVLDAAKAGLAAARQELERTEIRATVSGVVTDPVAEEGDMLSVGTACITIVDSDPMLFTGQISERQVGRIDTGMPAEVSLVSGETTTGTVRYISPSADAQTRTFRIEIELAEAEGVRDGMTAEALIGLPSIQAFRIMPSWLTLADDGTIGIRIAGDGDIVEFKPVSIIAQEADGFWINGPSNGDRIITLGQEYVVAGEAVDPELDSRIVELASGRASAAGAAQE